MAKKLVPPETWQGIPVEPHGEYQFRYWISKESRIGVVLEAMRDGSYEVEFWAHDNESILCDGDGEHLYVRSQRGFLPIMDLARVKIIEHYERQVQEADERIEEAKADATTHQAMLGLAANGDSSRKPVVTFWERLG